MKGGRAVGGNPEKNSQIVFGPPGASAEPFPDREIGKGLFNNARTSLDLVCRCSTTPGQVGTWSSVAGQRSDKSGLGLPSLDGPRTNLDLVFRRRGSRHAAGSAHRRAVGARQTNEAVVAVVRVVARGPDTEVIHARATGR